MRAPKLVQHMKTSADRMANAVIQKMNASGRCRDMIGKVRPEEQRENVLSIYSDLIDWLEGEPDAKLEQRYLALGVRRAQQHVPFAELFWVVSIANEYLWEHMQQECLIEEPVEFWGGLQLLRSLNQFFDRTVYFCLLGYQKAYEQYTVGASVANSR